MLKVTDLHAEINGKEILKGINLEVRPGEVHAIMGPNCRWCWPAIRPTQ